MRLVIGLEASRGRQDGSLHVAHTPRIHRAYSKHTEGPHIDPQAAVKNTGLENKDPNDNLEIVLRVIIFWFPVIEIVLCVMKKRACAYNSLVFIGFLKKGARAYFAHNTLRAFFCYSYIAHGGSCKKHVAAH